MVEVYLGFVVLGVVFVLIILLGLQMQVRSLSAKINKTLTEDTNK